MHMNIYFLFQSEDETWDVKNEVTCDVGYVVFV